MSSNGQPSALDAMFWRDEILQVLFWMQGEDLAEAVTARDLCVFLNGDESTIAHHLERLADDGYLDRCDGSNGRPGPSRYTLSEQGAEEGARRFTDAFEGMRNQGHGECSPDCDCQGIGHDPSCPSHEHHH